MEGKRKWQIALGYVVLALAYTCIWQGLTYPGVHVKTGLFGRVFLDQKKSTWSAMIFLYKQGPVFYLPATLVLFFSIIVPFLKGLLIIIGTWTSSPGVLYFVSRISKYQFVDVFGTVLNFVYMNNTMVHSELLSGIYYFSAYCVLSGVATQIIWG